MEFLPNFVAEWAENSDSGFLAKAGAEYLLKSGAEPKVVEEPKAFADAFWCSRGLGRDRS